jgi:two-component system, chemotaxis family, chemotaxis protein CheY
MTLPETTPPDATVPARKPLRVLYADDMMQLRELIVIVLARDGHTVETVGNGEQALEKISKDPAAFDVVITDHHMPGMNGLELVSCIRTRPFEGKIIVFSSELSHAVDAAYRRLKVDHILPKPIFPAQLRAVFATL